MFVVFKQELFVLFVKFHNLASKGVIELLCVDELFLMIISFDLIENILCVVYILLFESLVDLDKNLVDLVCFVMAIMVMRSAMRVSMGVFASMAFLLLVVMNESPAIDCSMGIIVSSYEFSIDWSHLELMMQQICEMDHL